MKQNPRISIIVALSKKNRAIGYQNKLLWKIEGDLPRFKHLTTGHPVIMGNITFESIGKALPGRKNIVIALDPQYEAPDCEVVHSIEDALELAKKSDEEEVFVIGGGTIYKQMLPFADRLYLTLVDDEPEGDTFFPDYSEFTKEIDREEHPEHNPPFTFLTLERG